MPSKHYSEYEVYKVVAATDLAIDHDLDSESWLMHGTSLIDAVVLESWHQLIQGLQSILWCIFARQPLLLLLWRRLRLLFITATDNVTVFSKLLHDIDIITCYTSLTHFGLNTGHTMILTHSCLLLTILHTANTSCSSLDIHLHFINTHVVT